MVLALKATCQMRHQHPGCGCRSVPLLTKSGVTIAERIAAIKTSGHITEESWPRSSEVTANTDVVKSVIVSALLHRPWGSDW